LYTLDRISCIKDFIIFQIIQKAFSKYIELKQDESFTIAHIHLIADELKEQISNLLAVFRVETCTAKDSVSQAVKDRICTLEQDGEKTSGENEAAASDVGVHNTGKMSFPVNNGESTLLQFKNQMPVSFQTVSTYSCSYK